MKIHKTTDADIDQEAPLIEHLIELRTRLLRTLIAIAAVFFCLVPFSADIYALLARPLLEQLPETSSMIATEVASPFLTPFKMTLVLAIFITIPYVLYQIWAFVAPGLYQQEKRLVVPLLASSSVLFYLGAAFAYFAVFPIIFGFFTRIAPEGVAVMTDINHYFNFTLKMFFAFGIAFETPIATLLTIRAGLVSAKKLAELRPYIIVALFVIAMLLTPPDVISQSLFTIPMWLLFELGLLLSKWLPMPDTNLDVETDSNH
ncbi:MAG TPA: twin-arginine translocase subunit TatC [Gammaproteobacteria bacterium]|nr:twin-arginine translocase subunit TatC [Gammaproteobacteria bacterium]